ncbi:hypothetical protein BHE74_00018766 [Ensete ventricosum]|nr:hypothetical protein GW17_00004576 [Ensete ventricosum]RWW73370.1 hypothetical protein BHE74_00018766 [Ensete ventricosum]
MGGNAEIGRRRSISIVGGRLRKKEEEGEEEKGEKSVSRAIRCPWAILRRRASFYLRGETRREGRREHIENQVTTTTITRN